MSSPTDVLGYFLPNALLSQMFSELMSFEDICRFDSAITNKKKRMEFLDCIKSKYCIWIGDKNQGFSSHAIYWLESRSINLRYLKCSQINDDIALKVGSFGSSLHWLSLGNYEVRNQKGRDIKEMGIVRLAEGCTNLRSCHIVMILRTMD
jgi:hypothetical protein